MADLDDFFAKKDRSKKKNVKKFTTADEIAKKLEDPKQKTEVRSKKERPTQDGEDSGRAGEEEEWKEYEEPVKDYTGLKIQVLQGGNGAPESGRDAGSEDSAPEGGKVKGPWNKPVEAEQPAAAAAAPAPQEEAPKPQEPKSKAYVAPAARARPDPVPLRRNQQKHAPDIHNDDYFPVLGAGAKPRAGAGAAGQWSTPAPASAPPRAAGAGAANKPLALDNRFTSLQDS